MGKMGVCRNCNEWGWIIDSRGYCVDCADRPTHNDTLDDEEEKATIERYTTSLCTLNRLEQNLVLLRAHKSEYVLQVDIPLQLVKEERQLEQQIDNLKHQLSLEGGINVVPA